MSHNRQTEIQAILDLLAAYWHEHPDLRLCQIIGNIFGADDHYTRRDDELYQALVSLNLGTELDVRQSNRVAEMRVRIEQLKRECDDLARGRITSTHAERVTPEMLRAYLEGASGWECYLRDGGCTSWQSSSNYCEIDTDPGMETTQTIGRTIATIAEDAGKGELAVYLDIMQGGQTND